MNEPKTNEYLLVLVHETVGKNDPFKNALLELALEYETYAYSGETENSYIFYSPCNTLDIFEKVLLTSKFPITVERFTKVDGAPF